MRHKYDTRGIILGHAHSGEDSNVVFALTEELGLVHAYARGVRRPGAKLASALTTLSESQLMLVQGKGVWRLVGAVLEESWFTRLSEEARRRAARVAQLILRFVVGETVDTDLFPIVRAFLTALAETPESDHQAAEILVVLQILRALGLDAGDLPGGATVFSPEALAAVAGERQAYLARVNAGITASGL